MFWGGSCLGALGAEAGHHRCVAGVSGAGHPGADPGLGWPFVSARARAVTACHRPRSGRRKAAAGSGPGARTPRNPGGEPAPVPGVAAAGAGGRAAPPSAGQSGRAAAALPAGRLLNPGRRGRPRPGGAGGGGAAAGEEPGPAVEPQPGAAAAGAAGPGESQRRPGRVPRTGARGAPRGRSRGPAEGGGGAAQPRAGP